MEPKTSSFHSSEFLLQEGLHTAPCCLTSNRQQEAEAGRQNSPSLLPTSRQGLPPRKAEHWQVPFAHRMVLCRTCCMADTVFSQATCGEDRDCGLPAEHLSHQRAGLTVPHTHTGHHWALTGLTAG